MRLNESLNSTGRQVSPEEIGKTGGGKRVAVIDSHTGGEPTRIVIGGGPDLGGGSITDKLNALKRQDEFRSAVVNEPRGSDAMVGAILSPESSEF